MMGTRAEESDASKIPVEIPGYGTFAQPAVPPVGHLRSPPHIYQQQPHLPPAPPVGLFLNFFFLPSRARIRLSVCFFFVLNFLTVIPVGYQPIPYTIVAEGIPIRERRLPCGGIGIGWVL